MSTTAPQSELEAQDYVIAISVSLLSLLGFLIILFPSPAPTTQARINYQEPKTSVEIMPIVAQIKQGKLIATPGPNPFARKPAPARKHEESTSQPSTKAATTKDPDQHKPPPDAGPPPPEHAEVDASGPPAPEHPEVDASAVAPADASTAVGAPGDASTPSVGVGSPDGGSTTGGPPRGIVNRYRATLAGWFVSRFAIRGKIPFERLKALRGHAVAQLSGRTVTGFTITGPSGDGTFDAQMNAALQSTVGQLVPKPPDEYPELLTPTLDLSYMCTIQAQCE